MCKPKSKFKSKLSGVFLPWDREKWSKLKGGQSYPSGKSNLTRVNTGSFKPYTPPSRAKTGNASAKLTILPCNTTK